MGYRHFICDPQELDDLLDEINKENMEITQMVYASDSRQVICVCKEGKKSFLKEMKKNIEAKKEEPEEE